MFGAVPTRSLEIWYTTLLTLPARHGDGVSVVVEAPALALDCRVLCHVGTG